MEFQCENDIVNFVTDFEFKHDINIIENKIKKRPIRVSTLLRVFKSKINDCAATKSYINQKFYDILDIAFELLNVDSNEKNSLVEKCTLSRQTTIKIGEDLRNHFGSLGENFGCLNYSKIPSIRFPESLKTIKIDDYKYYVNKITSYKYFWLPVNIALSMAGISEGVKLLTEKVMLELGFFYDVHLSFYNIFFNEHNEKEIEDKNSKLSWFIIKAYEKSSLHQKQELEKIYNSHQSNTENKAQLVELFKKLDIPSDFMDYEAKTFDSLLEMINNLPNIIPKQLFSQILLKISNKNEIGIGKLIFQY